MAGQLNSGREPFEQFVLVLGLVSGVPLLFGAPAPGSTAELLGPFLIGVWAWLLVGGCLIALIGTWWTAWSWLGHWWSRIRPAESTGLLIEQVGLVFVGGGAAIYAVGVAAVGGDSGRYVPAALVAGLSLACLWRVGRIQGWKKATLRQGVPDGSR